MSRSGLRVACVTLLALATLSSWIAVPALALVNQGPVLRVLRQDDVPGEANMYLPSGALGLKEFVSLTFGRGRSRRAFAAALRRDGYQGAAISGFNGGDFLIWRSYAIAFGSPGGARAAVAAAVRATASNPPNRSAAQVSPDRSFKYAYVLTFSGGIDGLGGVELIAAQGDYLYSLTCTDKPGRYHRAAVERLLHRLIGRA